MLLTFDELSPDLQDTVSGVTEMVNNKVYSPDWNVVYVPILKPFDWYNPPDVTADELPHWSAHYQLAEGKWVFKGLADN